MESQQRIWNRDFIQLWVANFFVFTTFYALIATIPLFVIEALAGDKQQSGVAMMVFLAAAVVFRLFSGRLLDTLGRKKVLYFAVILFMISSLAYLLIDHIVVLVLLRIIHGASFGIATTATGTLAADLIPINRRGEGIGYYALSYNTAMFFGPFLGLTIMAGYGFSMMFTVLTGLSVFAVIFALLINIPERELVKEDGKAKRIHWSSFVEPNAIPIAATALFLSFAFSGFLTYIPLYAQDLGMPQYATYFYIVYALVMILSRPFVGKLADSYNENIVVYGTIFLYAVGLAVLSQANHPVMFLVAAAIIGLGFGSTSPILQAMAVKSTSPEKTGLATGTYLSFFDTGVALGSFFLAIVAEATGFRVMYGSSILLVLIALVVFYVFQHRATLNKGRSIVHGTGYKDSGM